MGIQFGFFAAWVYLRFVKFQEGQAAADGFRGDRSDAFAFHMWFPPPVQSVLLQIRASEPPPLIADVDRRYLCRPYIAAAGNFVFKLCVRLGLVRAWGSDEFSSGGAYSLLPGPGGARAEAERRRALALKALDARLQGGSAPTPGSASGAGPSGSAPAAGTAGASVAGSSPSGAIQADLPAVPKPAAQEQASK